MYPNTYKSNYNEIKEEVDDADSQIEEDKYVTYKHDRYSKRAKKIQYKSSRDMLMDTPPMIYKLGNMVKRVKKYEGYDGGMLEYDPNQTYYVIPSSHVNYGQYPQYETGYYQGHQSPMAYKVEKKKRKDKHAPMYHPFYGMAPVGICPGCGGKKALIPTRTPAKQAQAPAHEYEQDFLEKISPSAFTPLRSKHNSDSKHSSGQIMYPNFLSPTQALKKPEEMPDLKHIKEEKLMYQFIGSEVKTPYRHSPTPNKRSLPYCASGTKIYKEDMTVPDLHNNLFSQDPLDENNKSPFSFLKTKTNPVSQMAMSKNREAFNNITNTLNKSPFFDEKKKNIENCVPKVLTFEQKKQGNQPQS